MSDIELLKQRAGITENADPGKLIAQKFMQKNGDLRDMRDIVQVIKLSPTPTHAAKLVVSAFVHLSNNPSASKNFAAALNRIL